MRGRVLRDEKSSETERKLVVVSKTKSIISIKVVGEFYYFSTTTYVLCSSLQCMSFFCYNTNDERTNERLDILQRRHARDDGRDDLGRDQESVRVRQSDGFNFASVFVVIRYDFVQFLRFASFLRIFLARLLG